jgi:hypothetical protein
MDQLGRERVLGALYNKIEAEEKKSIHARRDQRMAAKAKGL